MTVQFKKLHPSAIIPKYATIGSNGLDLIAISKEKVYDINNGNLLYISYKTGLAISLPENYCGLLLPRSSISKTSLSLANSCGLIDTDFRGEIEVRFRSLYPYNKEYEIGEKIAQLLVNYAPKIELIEVERLSETERDSNGFGSTDIKKLERSQAV